MRLYLVQHGQALHAAEHPDRPLTDAVRRWLAARGLVLLERRSVAATRSRVPPAPGG